MSRSPGLFLCMASVLTIACGTAAEPNGQAVTVRDSAGIRIVEYGDALLPIDTLTVGEPIYRHGSGPGDYLFQRVFSGALAPDGGAVVLDAGAGEAIYLAPDGLEVTKLTTEGEGPRQTQRPMSVHYVGQNSWIVEDDGNSRFLRIANGEVTTALRLDGMAAFGLRAHAIDLDGYLLMGTSSFRSDAGDGWIQGHMVRLRLDTLPAPDTVAEYDLAIGRPRGEPADPFGPNGVITATPLGFVGGRTDRAELAWRLSDGTLDQIVRWKPDVAYPTQEDFDTYVERYRVMLARFNAGMPEDRIDQIVGNLRVSFDRPLPVYGRLQGHSDGSVWLTDFQPSQMLGNFPRQYTVLSSNGVGLRSVVFPESVFVLDVFEGRVLGLVTDDFDVQHIVEYELPPA